MKKGGLILAQTLEELGKEVKIGVIGEYLEKKAQGLIASMEENVVLRVKMVFHLVFVFL